MKKTLLALAVLGAVGAANAQTAIVIDGSIDTSIQNVAPAAGANTTGLATSRRSTNYIGISGTENIGGGLKAIFQVRTGYGSDANIAASSVGDQNVWLGLQGGFGTVKLGRDLTPQFLQVSAYSAFGTGFLSNLQSMNTASTNARWNNSVQYVSPNLSGFGLQLMTAPRQEVNNFLPAPGANAGVPLNARLTYGAGPLSAGLAVVRNASAGPDTVWNLGAAYNFGVATLKAQFERDQNTGLAAGNKNAWLVGAEGALPGTAIVLKAQYAKRNAPTAVAPVEKAVGFGADYNLSKRTVGYLYWGKSDLAVGSSRETVLGVRHAF